MKAVTGALIQRSDAAATTLAAIQATIVHTTARSSRPANDLFCATRALTGYSPYALHDDRVDRDIVETATPAGLDRRDLVDNVHAFGNARKNGVADVPARRTEQLLVFPIDEEPRARASA